MSKAYDSYEWNDKQLAIDLFNKIKHGDTEHRVWLRNQIIEFFGENMILPLYEEEFDLSDPEPPTTIQLN